MGRGIQPIFGSRGHEEKFGAKPVAEREEY